MTYESMLSQKQYARFYGIEPGDSTNIDMIMMRDHNIFLRSYQQFVRTHINPNSTASRLLVKHGTGSGKTKAALFCAMEFSKYYKMQGIDGRILVLGFQRDTFLKELMSNIEYGFVTSEEIEEMRGPDRKIIETRVKRRIVNPKYGGYFIFMGYKEFFNRLFEIPTELWREYGSTVINEDDSREFLRVDEERMIADIAARRIKVNFSLMQNVKNGLLICDEVHNVYNSQQINSYGFAIKYLLNYYDEKDISYKLSALFLTATIANNKATEVVDALNLVIPITQPRLDKAAIFDDNGFLQPKALNLVAEACRDYVSFLITTNPKDYPRKVYEGEYITIPPKLMSRKNPLNKSGRIPYLKFTRCYMSEYHLTQYKKHCNEVLNINTLVLNDIALPIPDGFEMNTKSLISVYAAHPEWMESNGLYLSDLPDVGKFICGDIFRGENLNKYSSKYARMLELIKDEGKVFIAHPYIRYGVFIIQEVLRENGYIELGTTHSEDTICAICSVPYRDHKQDHEFKAACFANVYGGIKAKAFLDIKNKYDSPANIRGEYCKVLIGSRTLFEGKDFKCIRRIIIASYPGDISSLIQIIGRGVRYGSHNMLPPNLREVKVNILVSSMKEGLTYEEDCYFTKMEDYLTIQQLEQVVNSHSADAVLNYTYTNKVDDELLMLPFKPSDVFGKWTKVVDGKVAIGKEMIETQAFDAFYNDEEVTMLVYVIKRLLLEESPVYHIDDLWKRVQRPPFSMPYNGMLYDFDNFLLAIALVSSNDILNHEQCSSVSKCLTAANKRIIATNGDDYIICGINDYLMMLPYKPIMEHNTLGINLNTTSNSFIEAAIDVNTWSRIDALDTNIKYDITYKLEVQKLTYEETKHRFYVENRTRDIFSINYFNEVYNLQFHQQLICDTILYVFYVLINTKMSFSEMHEFYFKLLYFYYRLNLIIFASDIRSTEYYKYYERFVTDNIDSTIYSTFDKDLYEMNPLLMSSYTGIMGSFNVSRFNEILGDRSQSFISQTSGLHFVDIRYQIEHPTEINRVPCNILPVGHFLTQTNGIVNMPTVYIEDQRNWIMLNMMRPEISEIENDILVGYLEQDPHSIKLNFKIRERYKDVSDKRLLNKGINCYSKNKEYLEGKIKELGAKSAPNIYSYCDIIKNELINREIMALKAYKHGKPKIRWFYFHYEKPL